MLELVNKRYVRIATGQIHLTENSPPGGAATSLYCIHATAYSGQTFHPLLRAMENRRRLVAPDTPGYGASDRPAERWDVAAYARALGELIALEEPGPVDLFGYHTGALVAAELAVQSPKLVRRIVLVGVPLYYGAARAERLAHLGKPMTLTEDMGQFSERWNFFVEARHPGQSLERGFANFVDELRAYPYGWWAHDAAFTYPAEQRLGLVSQPVLILNPENHLSAPSREAASLIPNSRIVELPHLQHAIFDIAADEIADLTEGFLGANVGAPENDVP